MRVDWILAGTAVGLALFAGMPDALADDLMQTVCNPWVPATALSLTLVTAVIKSQK